MSVKGKEKADGGGSDVDSDIDFFTHKRRIFNRKEEPIRLPSSSPEYETADSDASDSQRKRRKKKKRPVKKVVVPSWMEVRPKKEKWGKGRGSSGSRDRSVSKGRPDVIEIIDSEEEKETAQSRRERILREITPPPPLPESEKHRLKQLIDKFLPIDVPDNDDNETPSSSTRTSSNARKRPAEESFQPDERVTINLRMVADPARRAAGDSERAIQRYEIKRIMYVNRRDPFSRMLGDLADRIGRDAKDLVLEHEGSTVYSGLTPFRLGLQADTETDMLGYETAVYEKVLKKREADKRRRIAEINGDPIPEEEDDGDGGDIGESEAKQVEEAPTAEVKKGTILRMRGKWGEVIIKANDSITVKMLVSHYCKKREHVGEEAKVRLEFDGEELEPEFTVGEMDVEDRVILDVKIVE